jgi:hypothetical protein
VTVQHHTRKIGETTYRVKLFANAEGRAMFGQLLAILKEPLSKITGGIPEAIAAVLGEAPRFLGFYDAFAARTDLMLPFVAGGVTTMKPIPLATQTEHFTARYDELLEWLLFVVEVNFATSIQRFLGRAPDIAKNVRTTLGLPEKDPESIGGNGESSSPEGAA